MFGFSLKNVLCFILGAFILSFAGKDIYLPRFFSQQGIDFESASAKWSRTRMDSTENWIILWESGFGNDPSTAPSPFKVNMKQLKEVLEKSYDVNLNTLKMVEKGASKTDQYKMIVFLTYTETWAAYGSGYDDVIGSLEVNPAAANMPVVVAHEIGHTFQYQTGCDVPSGGFRYGLGENGKGGNGFWEQGAQWAGFKVYPEEQFRTHDFNTYISSNHLHILHETPRYANYFIPDYWAYKQGIDFMGRLWRESRRPEDPVEAYKRIFGLTQKEFNDEIYEHAARLTTWDLPSISSYGANYIHRRSQVKMNKTSDNFWRIDASVTPENYGYNSIKLNVPNVSTLVSVQFQGLAGSSGYRVKNLEDSGWRFGFVALLQNGERVYSDMSSLDYSSSNPTGTLSFMVPNNTSNLWLVVSGAPQKHAHHEWDDNDDNDEQLPYQVKFSNTNLLGEENNISITYHLKVNIEGKGSVSPTTGDYPSTSLTIQAQAEPGYTFDYWGGDLSGKDPNATLALDQNREITAYFTKIESLSNTLPYTISMPLKNDYTPQELSIDLNYLSSTLDLSPEEIKANWGKTLLFYGIHPDGSYEQKSTAIAPGHWFDSLGNIVEYGENSFVYSEIDTNQFTIKVGQYPNRSKLGDAYKFKQALVYKKSEKEEIQIIFDFVVTIENTTSIAKKIQYKIPHQKQNFSTEIKEALSTGKIQVKVYNISGKQISKKQVREWNDLGIHRSGIYKIIWIKNHQIQSIQTLTYTSH